jgi:hypothetical protein
MSKSSCVKATVYYLVNVTVWRLCRILQVCQSVLLFAYTPICSATTLLIKGELHIILIFLAALTYYRISYPLPKDLHLNEVKNTQLIQSVLRQLEEKAKQKRFLIYKKLLLIINDIKKAICSSVWDTCVVEDLIRKIA